MSATDPIPPRPPRSALIRGVTLTPKKQAEANTKAARKPFIEATRATQPNLRIDFDGGTTNLLVPWIAQTEVLRMGPMLVAVFGAIEITVQMKRREAQAAGWMIDEIVVLLQTQKLDLLRDDPELGCSVQAFRLETNADGETERLPLMDRYADTGLGAPEESEEPDESDAEPPPPADDDGGSDGP